MGRLREAADQTTSLETIYRPVGTGTFPGRVRAIRAALAQMEETLSGQQVGEVPTEPSLRADRLC